MTLSANQQAELEKPVTRFAFFAEFYFLSLDPLPLRVTSLPQTVTWGGYDWLGLGSLGSISAVEEAQGTTASALIFQLNIAQIEMLALATGDTAEYRGRNAVLYFTPLDEQFRLVQTGGADDAPQVCWRGTMDLMQIGIEGKAGESSGRISLKCETSAYGLKRKANLRINAAQQKQRYPADTGLDYLTDLLGNPDATIWLSKRFQQI